jgi:SAM-dependent methyltransferase
MSAGAMTVQHTALPPSAWLQRFAPLIPAGGEVLDLACGSGRHIPLLLAQGLRVTGVDRDAAALAEARAAAGTNAALQLLQADIETGAWPLAGRRFAGIVVTNYLWRPLWPAILAALDDGGVWIHETFAQGHQRIGRPSRPDFLLQPGELLQVAQQARPALRVVAFEDGFEPARAGRSARYVQRIAAVREAPPTAPDTGAPPEAAQPPRYPLDGPGTAGTGS